MIRNICLAFSVLTACSLAYCSPADTAATSTRHTKLILLGTGNPNADPQHWGPAVAIVVNGEAYLVDAGVGVVRRAAAAAANGEPALMPQKLKRVFITHLHSDHTLGLPDLMFSPWVLGRPVPLDVYGPPGIDSMTYHIEEAWSEDIDIRLHGGEPQTTRNYHAVTHEIVAGKIYEDSNVKVEAIPVLHGTWKHAYGFRFTTSDGVIVISGDTRPTDSIVDACQSCDILVHEVYSAEKFSKRPPEWQNYHKAFHTSTIELATIAQRSHPKTLVLYHQLCWGTSDADLVKEIHEAGYLGNVVSGKDLDVFEVGGSHIEGR